MSQNATKQLLALPDETFTKVVNADIRNQSPPEAHAALRTPEVVGRWLGVLREMQDSVDAQTEVHEAELELAEVNYKLGGSERVFLEQKANHLKWKQGSIRFALGLRVKLLEAEQLRAEFTAKNRVLELEEAILRHQRSFDQDADPSEEDLELWSHVKETARI